MATVNEEISFVSGDWSASYAYRVFSITGNVVELRLWHTGNAVWWGNHHSVQFDTSTGIWSDPMPAEVPNVFSSTFNGTRSASVTGYPTSLFGFGDLSSSTAYWEITTPSWARQSSGGGTGTEEILFPSGSVAKGYQTLTFTVNKSSPLTSSVNLYRIFKDHTFLRTINHSSSTEDAVSIEPNPASGVWRLWHDDTANLTLLGSYTIGSNKKVSCNFW